MSGSSSSAPASVAAPPEALSFTVHALPVPELPEARRTRAGRLRMLLVLAICAAPVIASYVTYFVIRPAGHASYSTLIEPVRPLPPQLPLADLQGRPVAPASLEGQWLLVVVAGGACDNRCERALYVQRQLREALGRDKDRLDKVWLVPDGVRLRPELQRAIDQGVAPRVLRVPREALEQWLQPGAGQALEAHLYVVDPMGRWMMRAPPEPDPMRLGRDLERLLRASASWDRPGR
jgi:hypothetical protein